MIEENNYNNMFQKSIELFNSGNIDESELICNNLLKLIPKNSDLYNLLGRISSSKKDYKNAQNYFKSAIEICPNNLDFKFNIIFVFYFQNDYENAEYYCKEILELNPNNIKALKQILALLYLQSKTDEYKKFYKSYMTVCHTDFDDINRSRELCLDLVSPIFNTSNSEIDNYREIIINKINQSKPFENKNFIEILDNEDLQPDIQLSYHGRDNKQLKIKYYDLFKGYFDNKVLNFNKDKIKIGFLFTKSSGTIFITFMSNLINSFPIDSFEIYLICDKSSWEVLLKDKINEYVELIFLRETLTESANEILKFNLDILYHWEVGTGRENYFLSFFRLAPVQCTSIGWPDTTGIDTIDYFISSNLIESEDADDHYTEKLVRFNKLPFDINSPKSELPENEIIPLEEFGLDKNTNIYLCCQNIRKIHPDFDTLVLGILNKDANGVVVFVKKGDKSISELLKSRIIDKNSEIASRIIVLDELLYTSYLSLLTHAKVILDTLYFGGANTSYEAFAMNAPVVTFPWTHERGRYTLGCYKQMGVEGLVANSFQEYIDLAVKTANDKDFRDKVVKDISENNHKLFNDKEVIQEYIDFFESVARNVNK